LGFLDFKNTNNFPRKKFFKQSGFFLTQTTNYLQENSSFSGLQNTCKSQVHFSQPGIFTHFKQPSMFTLKNNNFSQISNAPKINKSQFSNKNAQIKNSLMLNFIWQREILIFFFPHKQGAFKIKIKNTEFFLVYEISKKNKNCTFFSCQKKWVI
jgi:hypothetical protein